MGKLSPASQAKHTDTTTEPEPEQRGDLQKEIHRLGVMVPLISTMEAEVGGSARVQSHPSLCREFKDSQGY